MLIQFSPGCFHLELCSYLDFSTKEVSEITTTFIKQKINSTIKKHQAHLSLYPNWYQTSLCIAFREFKGQCFSRLYAATKNLAKYAETKKTFLWGEGALSEGGGPNPDF